MLPLSDSEMALCYSGTELSNPDCTQPLSVDVQGQGKGFTPLADLFRDSGF